MEDWALRALKRWPNVPVLFGWLGLDRRGRWLIKGEVISRPQIIDTISRNYAADEHGRWYFQNGPQRGYVKLEIAPLILHATVDGESLIAHTGVVVEKPTAAYLDEEGSILIVTEHGPSALRDNELDWALQRLHSEDAAIFDEEHLAAALALPSGSRTSLHLRYRENDLTLHRLDAADSPAALGFVADPQPRNGDRVAAEGSKQL